MMKMKEPSILILHTSALALLAGAGPNEAAAVEPVNISSSELAFSLS